MPVTNYLTIDGGIVSEVRGGDDRDYLPDPQGSVVALLDATQTKTDAYSYWPFGEERTHVGVSPTPFRFLGTLGYYSESNSDRVYVRARYYRPTIARWQTLDPIWPNEPAYVYVDDSPVLKIDPSGLASFTGKGTCYCGDEGFRNCTTACGKIYNSKAECGPYVAVFPKARTAIGCKGSGCCGYRLKCTTTDAQTKTKEVTVTVGDTGGQEGNFIIDFGCCYLRKIGGRQAAIWTCTVLDKKGSLSDLDPCNADKDGCCSSKADCGCFCKGKYPRKDCGVG